jgi:cell division protein FtsN
MNRCQSLLIVRLWVFLAICLPLEAQTESIIARSPDGKQIALSRYEDNHLYIWDIKTGAETNEFVLFERLNQQDDDTKPAWYVPYAKLLEYTPDGKRIIATSDTTTVVVDAETGQELQNTPTALADTQPDSNAAIDNTPIVVTATDQPVSGTDADKTYRIQVGAFKNQEYAANSFNRLQNAGFSPIYERYHDFNRVIVTGIQQEEIDLTLQKLSSLGFNETVIKGEL